MAVLIVTVVKTENIKTIMIDALTRLNLGPKPETAVILKAHPYEMIAIDFHWELTWNLTAVRDWINYEIFDKCFVVSLQLSTYNKISYTVNDGEPRKLGKPTLDIFGKQIKRHLTLVK